jgi:hypothetical protein
VRALIKERIRQKKVARALLKADIYPESLPTPGINYLGKRAQQRLSKLKSVALFLGPYRNLTTLSASILFLHPECQVLNHAGERVFPNADINFLSGYSDKKFHDFKIHAMRLSQGGARGQYGGSIALSHAFAEHAPMREAYFSRYGGNLMKSDIRSLVWKESQRVTRILRSSEKDLDILLKRNKEIRFLLPIRNPIDCANSIRRVGLKRIYGLDENTDLRTVIDLVLEDLHWFLNTSEKYPGRFFHFFQHKMSAPLLQEMADFLEISRDKRWIKDTLDIYKLRKPYAYEQKMMKHFSKRVNALFKGRQQLIWEFLGLVGAAQ